jgi:predicted O-linked N-acetylglucosamine transferase (SPINDLY family)
VRTISETCALALQHHQAGDFPRAEHMYRQVLQVDPGNADAHHLLGVLAYQLGRSEQAVASIRHAITINPWNPAYHSNLGVALEALGQPNDAAASYEQALRLQPDYAEAHNNLGNVLLLHGKLHEAVGHYHLALQFRQDYPEAHNGLAHVFFHQGKLNEAVAHYLKAIGIRPDYSEAHCGLGDVLQRQAKLDKAAEHYRQALASRPDYADAHNGLANVLQGQGRAQEAVAHYARALQIKPDFPEAFFNLGVALERHDDVDLVVSCFREAVRLKQNAAPAHNNLGAVLLRHGDWKEASACFQHALHLDSNLVTAQSNRLFCLNYDPSADPYQVAAEHVRWGQKAESQIADNRLRTPHQGKGSADPDRRLRIGYVSPDFRFHPLIRYLEPVLVNHSPEQVEVYCYAEVPYPDAVTAKLQGMVQAWCWTQNQSDAELAAQIAKDRIDILVDLAGHTAGNRLLVFASKPAPIQVTWLGYMNTTGLRTIDYRLTDGFLDPSGQPACDAEELFRMPEGMCCFAPPTDSPMLSPLPAVQRGCITFGSLSSLFKLNERVYDLWSRLLHEVPTSRLLIFHHTLTEKARENLRQQFTNRDITSDRLDLRCGSFKEGYLSVYEEIDVSLDTFPYSSGVTSCESLWMGVPVISSCGSRPAGRNTAALLQRLGLDEWIADYPDEYVRKAVDLANELNALAKCRMQLRDRVASTLCNGSRFTRQLEDAYRVMWRRWCRSERQA